MFWSNRREAGERLADKIKKQKIEDPVLLGVARGGVVVAEPVARELACDLHVFVVRKLGVPDEPELAFGAVCPDRTIFLDRLLMRDKSIHPPLAKQIIEREIDKAITKKRLYEKFSPHLPVSHKNVILVDDGIATGASLVSAVRSLKKRHPKSIFVAAPICSASSKRSLEGEGAHMICLKVDTKFRAVGSYYKEFPQVTDRDVIEVLKITSEYTPHI